MGNNLFDIGDFTITMKLPTIIPVRVIFHDPATIVFWNDGSKTVVKCSEDDVFDKYTGFTMAYLKKAFGSSRKADAFADKHIRNKDTQPPKPKLIKQVFSIDKFKMVTGMERPSAWAYLCDGLTELEMAELGFVTDNTWMVNVDE